MPNYTSNIDRVFHALADPTRLAVIERLSRSPAPVQELAQPFAMALPSFMQHLRVLEASGLVQSRKEGRVRTYWLVPQPLQEAETWMTRQRALWTHRLDQLDRFLIETTEDPQ